MCASLGRSWTQGCVHSEPSSSLELEMKRPHFNPRTKASLSIVRWTREEAVEAAEAEEEENRERSISTARRHPTTGIRLGLEEPMTLLPPKA